MVGSMMLAVIAKATNATMPARNAADPWMRVKATPRARLRVEAAASAAASIFFVFIFLCQIPSDAAFIVPVADRLGRAVLACGNEPTEVQNRVQELFLFF